jgi:MoxR-like ATPase
METEFTNAIRNGGLFLLDEWDRAPAGVSVFLNSLLSNGHASLHGETIRAHEDFHFVAAGNTWMRGRSKRYSAGAQDLATVDRFAFMEWPTDESLEATLAGVDPSAVGAERPSVDLAEPQKLAETTVRDWVQYVQSIRKAMKHEETPYLASMRATLRGKKLLANGFPRDFVEDALIWRGASEDVRATVKEVAESYR